MSGFSFDERKPASVTPSRSLERAGKAVSTEGRALDDETRAIMEERFRCDLSRVRVHADTAAADAAQGLQAAAFTIKNHIAFDRGRYQPHTPAGRRLLAHELAHTVQQSRGHSRSAVRDGTAERGADAAEAAFAGGARPVQVAGESGTALMRKDDDPARRAENEVRVIADKGAGKLRVVLMNPRGELVAGLAEITPGRDAPLNPAAIAVYQQQVRGQRYPQVRVQTPPKYQAAVNPSQDVQVAQAAAEDPHTITANEAVEQDRAEILEFIMSSAGPDPSLALSLRSIYEQASPQEILKASQLPAFVEWKQKRAHDKQIAAENAYYKAALGPAGENVSPAQARQIYETYNPPKPRTEYEKQRQKEGLAERDIIRNPHTGERQGYRERHNYEERSFSTRFKKYKDIEFSEEYTRDIEGHQTGGRESGAKKVYAPWDYALDPLQLQDMAGIAEADPGLAVASDIATGAVKAGVKGAVKGGRALVNAGKREARKEALQGFAKAGEREAGKEGVVAARGGERAAGREVGEMSSKPQELVLSPSQVAEAAEHQAARAEGKELQAATREQGVAPRRGEGGHVEGRGAGEGKAIEAPHAAGANAPAPSANFFEKWKQKFQKGVQKVKQRVRGPLTGPTKGSGVKSMLNQAKDALKGAVDRATGGGARDFVEHEFQRTFDPAIADALYVEMIEKSPAREAGIWRNPTTGEHIIVQGSGDWLGGAVESFPMHGGPWEFVEHYHPEGNFAVGLPSPNDFMHVEALGTIQQGGTLGTKVTSKVRYRDPLTKQLHFTEYGVDPALKPPFGPYFVRATDAHGVPMMYSFSTLNEWQAQINAIAAQAPGTGVF